MKKSLFFEAEFELTYYFCNMIKNILDDQLGYARNLDGFYGNETWCYLVKPFQKRSTLHEFIEFFVDGAFWEEMMKFDIGVWQERAQFTLGHQKDEVRPLPIEEILSSYKIEHQSFEDFSCKWHAQMSSEDVLYDYYEQLKLSNAYYKLVDIIVDEVFFILFQNRTLMLKFNDMLAGVIEMNIDDEIPDDVQCYFRKNGLLKRQTIPKWVKRAIFFRDQGRCVLCAKDLSGTLNTTNRENYDHIVPLALFGFNDVSNMQLLCEQCNQIDKRAGEASTSKWYPSWY